MEARIPSPTPGYTKGTKLKVEFKVRLGTGQTTFQTVIVGTKIITAAVNAP